MAIEIKKVATGAELKTVIRFNYEMYKDCAYHVPELYMDMVCTLDRKKNPAFEFCDADYFLAYRDGVLVGRIAAIINHRANETWNQKVVRFGWIDFIDDYEVSSALLNMVKEWGQDRGMTDIEGPLGFTDLDPEGMLIEGFDQLSTMATIYNYDYYPKHVERWGMEKAADWVERKIYIPEEVPEKHKRISDIVLKKYGLRIRKFKSKWEVMRSGAVHKIFRLINEAYTPLFGFTRLTERQIDTYVKMYVPVLDLRMVTIIEDAEGEIIAVGVSMPSLSEALRKAKGKFLPFGWWHLMKALLWKKSHVLDLLLVAVRPDYQSKGVNAPLFTDLIPVYQQMGFEYAESNPQLEENEKVASQWQYFRTEDHKRRRCFKKSIV